MWSIQENTLFKNFGKEIFPLIIYRIISFNYEGVQNEDKHHFLGLSFYLFKNLNLKAMFYELCLQSESVFFGFFKYQNYFLFCEKKSWFPFLIAL